MLTLRTALLLIGATCALAACAPPEADRKSVRDQAPMHHVQALAADTVVVDGRHLKLSNAETPVRIPQARCWAEALAAREARRRVNEITANVRDIDIAPTGRKDEYGRELAQVSFDGIDLGDALIAEGMAVRPGAAPFDWCAPISAQMPRSPNATALADMGR